MVVTLSQPIIKKMIVREIIDNPVDYLKMSDEDLGKLLDLKSNPPGFLSDTQPQTAFRKMLKMAPRNSIIGVDAAPVPESAAPRIFFPLFSSHLGLPLKPGEAVWIIDGGLFNAFSKGGDELLAAAGAEQPGETLSATGSEMLCRGYWISRVTEPVYVDDPNFTHADRAKSIPYALQQVTPAISRLALPPPIFPNGILNSSTDGESYTELQTLRTQYNYNRINESSIASALTTREPVPAFTKRPGDLVLQGSNNTLICLGEDRPRLEDSNKSSVNYPPNSQTVPGPRHKAQAGTIDIVTGRSLENNSGKIEYKKDHLTPVENARNLIETERRTWAEGANGKLVKRVEGDPSFKDDLSRIYVSMKTDGDANFGFSDASALPNPGSSLSPVNQKPYVVVKSDEVRLIARKIGDSKAGSIRLIKEGTRNSATDPGDQAVISMQSDGVVMIDGPKIVIGSGNAKGNGQGDQVLIGGSSASEPIVLGNALKGIIGELITAITAMTVPTGVGPSGPPMNAPQFEIIRGKLDTILSQVGKTK